MKTTTHAWTAALLGVLCIAAAAIAAGPQAQAPPEPTESTPKAVDDLLYARRFTLEEPYPYDFSKERPEVRQGWILVVKADPEIARLRQVGHPVLYVNDVPAARINGGADAGRLVVWIPGKADLREARIYFGAERLPEQVDAAFGRTQLEAARAAGIEPFSKEKVEAAVRRGGESRLEAMNSYELYLALADLVDEFSPDEHELAESFRPK
jgi:hypothetical protein